MDFGRGGTMKKTSGADFAFYPILYFFMILVCIAMVYPFLFLLSQSFGGSAVMGLSLIPKQPTLSGYVRVFHNEHIWNGFRNTIFRVILGTSLTMFCTIITAYPLAKRYFPNRSLWTGLLVFTMFFSGGLIPSYLLVRSVGIYNTIWALVLPGLISTYNMIIMRNFFMSIPAELEESARIDGAGEFMVLFRIVVPISGPILATVALWTIVGHWNAWFDSMIYISSGSKQVLQQTLRQIILEGTMTLMDMNSMTAEISSTGPVTPDTVKAATIMIATMPIILVYPFLQKHFVKGVLIGSLKG
jgi:putative aldouronate transport system permease protein